MRLSEHFSLYEFLQSDTATRHGLILKPDSNVVQNLTALAHSCLEPIRREHGTTVITSGFRTVELCKLVNSSSKSQHIARDDFAAVDFKCYSIANRQLARWIIERLPTWDDFILEFPGKVGDPEEENDGWLHLSFKRGRGNRKKVRTAVRKAGKAFYKEGLF